VHLTPQEVEVLRCIRGVADLDVVFGGKRQEALNAGTRVFGPLTLVPVGEEQD
jgi:hypothetical protein